MRLADLKEKKYVFVLTVILLIVLACGIFYRNIYSFSEASSISYESNDSTIIEIYFDYKNSLKSTYKIKQQEGTMIYKDEKQISVQKPFWPEDLLETLRKNNAIRSYKKVPGLLIYDRYEQDTYFLPWNSEFVTILNSILDDEEFHQEFLKYQDYEWDSKNVKLQEFHEIRRQKIFSLEIQKGEKIAYDFYEDHTILKKKKDETTYIRTDKDFDDFIKVLKEMKKDIESPTSGVFVNDQNEEFVIPITNTNIKEILKYISDPDIEQTEGPVGEKHFYGGKGVEGEYYLVDDPSKGYNEKLDSYTCKTEDCFIVSTQHATYKNPIFVIYDDGYYTFNVENSETKKLPFEKKNISYINVENNYMKIKYEDQIEFYDYINRNTLFNHQDMSSQNGEKNIIFYNEKEWKVYSLEKKDFLFTRTMKSGLNNIETIFSLEKEYYIFHYVDKPDEIYDENFKLISDAFYFYGILSQEKFIVGKTNQSFMCGGAKCMGYIDIFQFAFIDQNGKEIGASKTYKSIQSFAKDKTNQIKYFFAIDENNMLNLYDINENHLLTIEMWTDKKVFCFDEIAGSQIVFSIGTNQYHYNTESKEIKNTTLTIPTCGAR